MRFEDVKSLLTERFGETSVYETNRVLEQAFPSAKKERTTIVFGLRSNTPLHIWPTLFRPRHLDRKSLDTQYLIQPPGLRSP